MAAEIAVVGLGTWGTAIAHHLAVSGRRVIGWSREQDVVDAISSSRRNPRYLSTLELHSGVSVSCDLAAALQAPIVIFALPSSALPAVMDSVTLPSGIILVSAIKGIIGEELGTPLQWLERRFGSAIATCVISGPSFAIDLASGRPIGLVAASKNEGVAQKVGESFSAPTVKVYLSRDPLGVELGGILKNVIAIAAGVSDALGFGESARAGLITRGLAEMIRLARAMGADPQTLFGLSGLGDLVMSASCDTSRNRTVGVRLGRGEKLKDIERTLGSTAEGIRTAKQAVRLAERYQVEMPITIQVDRLLRGEAGAREMALDLLARPMRSEF